MMGLISFINHKIFILLRLISTACILLILYNSLACRSSHSVVSNATPPPGMVLISVGNFLMGSTDGEAEESSPSHLVNINAFYLDQMEVTNRQFEQFTKETNYISEGRWERYAKPGREGHPVVSVTWNDAQAYAKWAKKRLPTEAEWEYAARGGRKDAIYGIGKTGINLDNTQANFGQIETIEKKNLLEGIVTVPITSYEPNPYGLYDMSGNAAEWCEDWYDSHYYKISPKENPQGPSFGRGRVVRGGSWNDRENYLRITHRMGLPPSSIAFVLGFRCAKDIQISAEKYTW